MSTKTVAQDLHMNCVSVTQAASSCDSSWVLPPDGAVCKFLGFQDIALDQILDNTIDKDNRKNRFNLWNILFPGDEAETYRRLEGEDMTPVLVYKSDNRYFMADKNSRLEIARRMGKAFILAEVWELPRTAPYRS